MAERRRQSDNEIHDCLKEGDIAVLLKFMSDTEKWVDKIAGYFISSAIGIGFVVIGIIAVLVKLYIK